MKHNAMCGETDLLIAFVPEATMGTAIEMWEAARHGRIVVTISPLDLNWAVQFCSDVVYSSVEAFEQDRSRNLRQRYYGDPCCWTCYVR